MSEGMTHRRSKTPEELAQEAAMLANEYRDDDGLEELSVTPPSTHKGAPPPLPTPGGAWENDPPTDRQIDYAFGLCTWLRDNNHLHAQRFARTMRDAITKKDYRNLIADMVKAKQEMED